MRDRVHHMRAGASLVPARVTSLLAAVVALQVLLLGGCAKQQGGAVLDAGGHMALTDSGLALSVAPSGDAVGLTWSSGHGAVVDPSTGRLSTLPGRWSGRLSWSPRGDAFTAVQTRTDRGGTTGRVAWVSREKLAVNGLTPWSRRPAKPDASFYSFAQWSDSDEKVYYQATDRTVSLMDPVSIHAAGVKGGDSRIVVGSLVGIERCCKGNRLLVRGPLVDGKRGVYVLDSATGGRHELLSDEVVAGGRQ